MAGKGDKPRNCYNKKFWDNYDLIKWSKNKKEPKKEETKKKNNF